MSRRLAYLAEIGIPAYALRGRPTAVEGALDAAAVPAETPAAEAADAEAARAAAARAKAAPADAAAPEIAPAEGVAVEATAVQAAPAETGPSGDDWSRLAAEVRDCRKCALHRGRTQTVFGVGRRDAQLLVVGEAPGEEEDRQGEPFVGRAGRLLNAMLRSIGLPREQVYIANILKCRPPGNRDPRPDEADACAGFLDRQIALIRPSAMLAVGRISAQRLLQTELPVGRLRGTVHRYGDSAIPLVVTYHPAYLLRTPIAKAKGWQDLCMVVSVLRASGEDAAVEADR